MTRTSAPWWLALLISGVSLLGSMYASYTHNDKEITSRLTTVESHQGDVDHRLNRMEDKLDRLIEWTRQR